jgi:hypothetical protein
MHALDTYQPWFDADLTDTFSATRSLDTHARITTTTADPSTTITHLAINSKEGTLDIRWADQHVSHFHFIWLRDHDCADVNATNQRNTDTAR